MGEVEKRMPLAHARAPLADERVGELEKRTPLAHARVPLADERIGDHQGLHRFRTRFARTCLAPWEKPAPIRDDALLVSGIHSVAGARAFGAATNEPKTHPTREGTDATEVGALRCAGGACRLRTTGVPEWLPQ